MSQPVEEIVPISLILKNFLSFYPAQKNIVERTWCVNASFPWHLPTIESLPCFVNSLIHHSLIHHQYIICCVAFVIKAQELKKLNSMFFGVHGLWSSEISPIRQLPLQKMSDTGRIFFILGGCWKTPICCVILISRHCGVLLRMPHSSRFVCRRRGLAALQARVPSFGSLVSGHFPTASGGTCNPPSS
jgi:hypothetical protein